MPLNNTSCEARESLVNNNFVANKFGYDLFHLNMWQVKRLLYKVDRRLGHNGIPYYCITEQSYTSSGTLKR